MSSKPRAFITGILGFTGRYLAQELVSSGYEVFGTGQQAGAVQDQIYNVNLLDIDELNRVVADVRPDVVAHLAAISFVAHENVDEIYRVNVAGTRNLLNSLVRLPSLPTAVLLASSANIYGNSTREVINELERPAPANDYAVSKLAMEYMANLWQDKLPLIIARPFNYTGLGQSENFLIPKIVSHFQRGAREIELGNIDVERDFSDVRTVVLAYRHLLQRATGGTTVNICSGRSTSLRHVIEMAEQIAGYHIEIKRNPAFVRANEVHRLLGDASKLHALIGDIAEYDLRDTLKWMLQASPDIASFGKS